MVNGAISGEIHINGYAGMSLPDRIHLTLHLADRRGYGMSLTDLSKMMLCGEAPVETVRKELSIMPGVSHLGAIFCLKGSEKLLHETGRRLRSNGEMAKDYDILARQFAAEYSSLCPFIKCIAIAGSMASGGFSEDDDIDYNIFVEKGSRYTVYLLGILLSLKYSFRFRRKPLARKSATPFLSKLICINVIWEDWESLPYSRRDMYMAYELLRQKPVFGINFYRKMLEKNRWLMSYFPQIYGAPRKSVSVKRTGTSRMLLLLYSSPLISRIGEKLCREASYLLWRFVQFSRRNNPEALERVRWVNEMQRPYALFGDRT